MLSNDKVQGGLMKFYKALVTSLSVCTLVGCTLKDNDENAGVSITGNTGKISGVILASQNHALGKISATTLDNDTFEVVLTSNQVDFAAETLWVALQETFLFDSLPQATFHISASIHGEEFSHIDGIPLAEGQSARVTMYSGADAPEAHWEALPKMSMVSFENLVVNGDLYILDEQNEPISVYSYQDRYSIHLPAGSYRVVCFYRDPELAISTEFIHFKMPANQDTVIRFLTIDTLTADEKIPATELPGTLNYVGIDVHTVFGSGGVWEGLQGRQSKVRFLVETRFGISCDYSGDTLKALQKITNPPMEYLLDQDGYGVSFSGPGWVRMSLINANGVYWDQDSEPSVPTTTPVMIREMDVGETSIPVKMTLIVEYQGDSVLKIDEGVSKYWNNLNVVYALSVPTIPNVIMPTHRGLWMNILWNGYNEDGDIWLIQSKSNTELQLIDYPHTGDTLNGIMLLQDGMTQSMDDNSYKSKRGYSDGKKVRIYVDIEAPYLITGIDTIVPVMFEDYFYPIEKTDTLQISPDF